MLLADTARAFTGLYEFSGVSEGAHRVSVNFPGGQAEVSTRTTAALLPRSSEGTFNVLLASCFYRREANRDAMRATLSRIARVARPHMSVLMGDQVYLDLPTFQNFQDDQPSLASKFEENYLANWVSDATRDKSRGFYDLLQMAPAVHLPDDHEYYNNAPHGATVVQNSWDPNSRARWLKAASRMYEAFQAPSGDVQENSYRVDVAPVSFLFMDSRSDRQQDRSRAFAVDAVNTIDTWVDRLNQNRLVGVFATGQPLLAPAVGRQSGRFFDWALANYGDYQDVMSALGRCQGPLVLLTGDVHYSRVCRAGTGPRKIIEVIVSPLALVKTNVRDEAREAWDFVTGLFGKSDPWPRHPKPAPAPTGVKFARSVNFSKIMGGERGKGDQLAVLQFSRNAGRVHLDVKYFHVQTAAENPGVISLLP